MKKSTYGLTNAGSPYANLVLMNSPAAGATGNLAQKEIDQLVVGLNEAFLPKNLPPAPDARPTDIIVYEA